MTKIRAGKYQAYYRGILFTVEKADGYGWHVEMQKGRPSESKLLAVRGTRREAMEEIREFLLTN